MSVHIQAALRAPAVRSEAGAGRGLTSAGVNQNSRRSVTAAMRGSPYEPAA
jgi:hypothetical protein